MSSMSYISIFFLFQAEDGIRDDLVTGVQTCALPISTCTQPLGSGAPEIASRRQAAPSANPGLPAGRLPIVPVIFASAESSLLLPLINSRVSTLLRAPGVTPAAIAKGFRAGCSTMAPVGEKPECTMLKAPPGMAAPVASNPPATASDRLGLNMTLLMA